MATGLRNASSILSKMKYDPLRQVEQQRFDQQEAMSNVAVSQRDAMLGKQVAAEQDKLMKLDSLGNDLAMRKDKLEFNKKIQKRSQQLAEDELDLKDDWISHKQVMDWGETIIGAASLPVSFANRIKSKKLHELEMKERKMDRKMYRHRMGNTPYPWEIGDLG